ncbi:hypothetical protein C9374_001322 [Naegleria lovaniensis]|uniref:Thiopurine S-methyltransferase n=1 Tax=Naegleria lovaniensis TaxID=51637 RepID=A0AA88KMM2_NAELO|nr:uncharacterized protein C9374_001322 [Naegleria lovaniensis]KAG2387728.1 hypothetical protein C9374_001322 [Naegleria lovaniensis]
MKKLLSCVRQANTTNIYLLSRSKFYFVKFLIMSNTENYRNVQYSTSQSPKNDLSKYGGMNNKDWDQLWRDQSTPWDTKQASPILKHLVETIYQDRADIKHALVPGCGNGYDVDTLSALKSVETVVGLDISETAIASANSKKTQFQYGNPNKVQFVCQDFFTLDKKFDIIFDYTFLCALPISLREAWAHQMKKLLNYKDNANAELVTLIFPLVKRTNTGDLDTDITKGPPYILSYPLVEKLLVDVGFENIEQYNVPTQFSHPARANNEIIARWRVKKVSKL